MRNYSTTIWTIWKTVKWFIFTLIIGLLPILLSYGLSFIMPSDMTFKKIIMDGGLLFFSLAIVSSMFADYYQSQEIFDIKSLINSLIIGIPFIVLITCIISFTLLYQKTEEQVDFNILTGIQLVILFMSFLYTILIKVSMLTSHQEMANRLFLLKKLTPKQLIYFVTIFSISHSSDRRNHKW